MTMGQFRETPIFHLLSIALFPILSNILLLSEYTVCNCTKELYKDLPTCVMCQLDCLPITSSL